MRVVMKVVTVVVGLLLFLAFLGALIGDDTYVPATSTSVSSRGLAPSIPAREVMEAEAVTPTWAQLARDPDGYRGRYLDLTGQVIQKVDDTRFRVAITRDEWGFWDDPIYVRLRGEAASARILEDDEIRMIGISTGEYTYTAIFGNSVTIPSMDAYYVDIVKPRE